MATYTSVTSGNFNSNTTWGTGTGVYPSADGDIFAVASGHNVTYNVTTALSTGLGTSTVNDGGVLNFSASSRMRINGDLNVYGTLGMVSNTQLYFRGTNRSLYFVGGNCQANLVGSNSTPTTTLSSAVVTGVTILPVASSSQFAVNDWIAVYKSHETKVASFDGNGRSYVGASSDEGFLINGISGNNIYVREYVGPSATITNISGYVVTVIDASVFRTYQKLVVYNSTNVGAISSINYATNQITIDALWSTGLIGSTIYTGFALKNHASGETVRKIAWRTAASYSAGATSITLNGVSGLSVNDTVHITSIGSATVGSRDRFETCEYTISAINGNVITISPGTVFDSTGDEYVFKTNRDVVVAADTGNTSSYRVYSDYTYTLTKRLRIKDVRFQNIGNFYGQGGFNWNGQTQRLGSTNTSDYVGSEIENNVIQMQAVNGFIDPWNYDLNGMFSDEMFGNTVRNNVFLNTHGVSAAWYDWDRYIYNNYSYNGAYSFRCEGFHTYEQGGSEMAYNLGHRGNEGTRCSFYNAGRGFHHNRQTHSYRPGHLAFNLGIYAFQNEWDTCNVWSGWAATDAGAKDSWKFVYNNFKNMSVGTDNWRFGNDISVQRANQEAVSPFSFLEHNFKLNDVMQTFTRGHRVWDTTEATWRVYRLDTTNDMAACPTFFYVPPNSTVTVTASIKRPANFAGTIPTFAINTNTIPEMNSAANALYAVGYPIEGESNTVQYTSASASAYETKTLTLPARSFGRFVSAYNYSTDAAAYMGWWEKEMDVQLSVPSGINQRHSDYTPVPGKYNATTLRLGG
jgi:hypothetical protein